MEEKDKCIDDLLDDFDKALLTEADQDLNNLPIEVEGPNRRFLENNPYAE